MLRVFAGQASLCAQHLGSAGFGGAPALEFQAAISTGGARP